MFEHIENSKLTVVVVFQQVSHSAEQVEKVDVHERWVAVNFATFCTKQVVYNENCTDVDFCAAVFRKTHETLHELVYAGADLSIIVVVSTFGMFAIKAQVRFFKLQKHQSC